MAGSPNEDTFLDDLLLPIDHTTIQDTSNASNETTRVVTNNSGSSSSSSSCSNSSTTQKRKSVADCDNLETWNLVSNKFHGYLSKKQKHAILARKEKGILSADPLSFTQYENQTVDTRIDKVGVMVHCGLNRPLFPDLHRNVLNYCEMTGLTVTEKYARFSLNTLVTKDCVSRTQPVVFPVLNQTLMNEIEYFNVNSGINFETFKVKRSNSDDYNHAPPIETKKMKYDDDVSHRRYSPNHPKQEDKPPPIETKKMKYDDDVSHRRNSPNHPKQEDKQISRSGRVTKSIDRDYNSICAALDKSQSTTVSEPEMINSTLIASHSNLSKTDLWKRPSSITPNIFSSSPNSEIKPINTLKRKRGRPKIIRNASISSSDFNISISPTLSIGDTSTPKPRRGRPPTKQKMESSLNSNSFKKTDQPEPPSINETATGGAIRKPIIIENDIVPEDDLAPEFHIFGEINCSRTYGRMVDYTTRNLSSIYLFKMRRVLNLQKKHNRYFKTDCEYIRITNNDQVENEIVDVESVSLDDQPNIPHIERGSQKHLTNPLKMIPIIHEFNGFGATIMKNPIDCIELHKNEIQFVDEDSLQDKRHVKKRWIILQLVRDFENIILEGMYDLPASLLFNVIYKADIAHRPVYRKLASKKRACATGTNALELGVYAVPGLSTAVLVGPLDSTFGDVPMITVSTIEKNSQKLNVQNVPILPCDNNGDAVVIAKLWQPNSCWRIISNVMDKFLKFQFNRSDAILDAMDDNFNTDKLCSEQLLSEHTARTHLRFTDNNEDEHFTLIHDSETGITPSTTTNCERVPDENEDGRFALIRDINGSLENGSGIPTKKKKSEEFPENYANNIKTEQILLGKNPTKNIKSEKVLFVENSVEDESLTDAQTKPDEITQSAKLEEKTQVMRSLESAVLLKELEVSEIIESTTPYVDKQVLENSASHANCSSSIEPVENVSTASKEMLKKLFSDPAAILGDEEVPSNKIKTSSRPKLNKLVVAKDGKIRQMDQEERRLNERMRRIELKQNKSYLCWALKMSSKSQLTVRESIMEAIKEVQNLTEKNTNLICEMKRNIARAEEMEKTVLKLIDGIDENSGIYKETMENIQAIKKLHHSELETIDVDKIYKEFCNSFSRDERNDTTIIKHQIASLHDNEINHDDLVIKSESSTNESIATYSEDLLKNNLLVETNIDDSSVDTSKNNKIYKPINFRKFSDEAIKIQCDDGDSTNNIKNDLKNLTTENIESKTEIKSIQANEINTAEKNQLNSKMNICTTNDDIKKNATRNEVCIILKENRQIFMEINDLKVDAEFIVTKEKIIEFISCIEESLMTNSNYNTKNLLKITKLRTLLSENNVVFQQSESNSKLITNLKSYNDSYECIFTSPLYCKKLHLKENETLENSVTKEIEQSRSEFIVNTENRVFIDDSIIVEIDNSC